MEKLLDSKVVAEVLGVTCQTLATWRCTRKYNLPYVKVGSKVGYRPQDIEDFLRSRTVNPQGERP